MFTTARAIIKWRGGLLVVWLVAVLIPAGLVAGEMHHAAEGTSGTPADVGLMVQEGLLSLRAQNASLKGIFEAIGQQLSIEVETRIPADERITLVFEPLSLTEALKRFRPFVNYMAIEDATKPPGTIGKLMVVSKRVADVPLRPSPPDGEGVASPAPSQSSGPAPAAPTRPKPFRFEFDPSAVGERGR
jgi:hypothetical protein